MARSNKKDSSKKDSIKKDAARFYKTVKEQAVETKPVPARCEPGDEKVFVLSLKIKDSTIEPRTAEEVQEQVKDSIETVMAHVEVTAVRVEVENRR